MTDKPVIVTWMRDSASKEAFAINLFKDVAANVGNLNDICVANLNRRRKSGKRDKN